MQTISAIFDSYDEASQAVTRLKQSGVPEKDISLMSNDANIDRSTYGDYGSRGKGDDASSGAGTGAGLGAAAGGTAGLLAGLGIIAIPGIGPLVAAGVVASTLVGAATGAGAGGIVGALTGAGMSDDDSQTYAEGIRRGGTLVTAKVNDGEADRARMTLEQGGYDPATRAEAWRKDGWTGRSV